MSEKKDRFRFSWRKAAYDMKTKNVNLESRIAKLEETLKFYAEVKNWSPQEYWHDGTLKQTSYAIGKDGGARARAALEGEGDE